MLGMMGIECVATTWSGKRIHLNQLNEFGGFLTVDEAKDWATKELDNYTCWQKYEKIEIYSAASGQFAVAATVHAKDVRPDLNEADLRARNKDA